MRSFQILIKNIYRFCLFIFLSALLTSCFNSDSYLDDKRVFRMSVNSEPPTLDWSLATDNVSFDIITNIMEGLTQFNEKLEVKPAIAKSWSISEGGQKIVFELRKDVKWTDGKAVTAYDFEYSWKRLLNPVTAAEYAYFLYDIKNAFEYNSGEIKDPNKVGIKAVSPHTLEVYLKKPAVYFPSITTFMVTFPQRKDIIEKFGDSWTNPENIITNGPFQLKEWWHEYRLALESNSGYYGKKGNIDFIKIYIVQENSIALTLYETGALDMLSAIPPVAIPHFKNSSEYINSPFLRGYYYGFNVKKAPFNDVMVRKAFSMSIDREEVTRILQGGEVPTSSWIPKGMFGYNPEIGLKFDPDRAKEFLSEAGYPNGKDFPEVTAVFNTDNVNRLIAENLQAQWKRNLNINVHLDNMEWKVFLKKVKVDAPGLFRLGWGADFPDPDNFMNLFTTDSGNNNTRWGNQVYDRLIEQGARETSPKKRQLIYDQAQRILTEEDAPIISLFVAAQNILIKPYIKGFVANAMSILYLKNINIIKD